MDGCVTVLVGQCGYASLRVGQIELGEFRQIGRVALLVDEQASFGDHMPLPELPTYKDVEEESNHRQEYQDQYPCDGLDRVAVLHQHEDDGGEYRVDVNYENYYVGYVPNHFFPILL